MARESMKPRSLKSHTRMVLAESPVRVNKSKSETKISDCFRGYCRPILTAALSIEQTKSRECPNARSWHNAPDLGVSQIRRQALVAMSQKSALLPLVHSAANARIEPSADIANQNSRVCNVPRVCGKRLNLLWFSYEREVADEAFY